MITRWCLVPQQFSTSPPPAATAMPRFIVDPTVRVATPTNLRETRGTGCRSVQNEPASSSRGDDQLSLDKTGQDKTRERHRFRGNRKASHHHKNVGLQRVLCAAHGRGRGRGRRPTKRHHRRRRRWGLRRSPWQRYGGRGWRWRGACRWRVRRSSDGGGGDVRSGERQESLWKPTGAFFFRRRRRRREVLCTGCRERAASGLGMLNGRVWERLMMKNGGVWYILEGQARAKSGVGGGKRFATIVLSCVVD